MIIDFHRNFDKRYAKLSLRIQKKVDDALEQFSKNPSDPTLKNHPLKGSMKGKRAFSVMGDLRIIFEERDNYTLVLMLDVGTHTQVYGHN